MLSHHSLYDLTSTHAVMLVQDVMQHPVITTEASSSIADAYRIMQQRDIRHLPVLDDEALVGIVTDRDLRFVTSRLHPTPVEAETPVREVMTEDPITAGPLDPVEEAARILRARKIGCLPVLDGDELVGILTGTNILDAILRLTGLEKPGGRLAVSLEDEPGQLARLTARVAEAGLDIRSVLTYYEHELDSASEAAPSDAERSEEHLRVIMRIDTLNVHALAATLRGEGFDVVWPVEKPTSHGSKSG